MGRLWLVVLGMMLSCIRLPAQSPEPRTRPSSGGVLSGAWGHHGPDRGRGRPDGLRQGGLRTGAGDRRVSPSHRGAAPGTRRGGLGWRAWRSGLRPVWGGHRCGGGGVADGLILGGLGIAVGLAVCDLATLKGGVRNRNVKSVAVMPVVRPETGAVGVAVHLTF